MEASDSVQPDDSGQGDENEGFVDSYLANVPEDYRPHIEPYLRDVESNTNKKFQEHSEYRKQWEPYEEIGLTEYDPEGIQNLLEFAELTNDPAAFREWWIKAGQETGFVQQLLDELGSGQNDLEDDEFDDEEPQVDINAIKEAVSNLIDEKLSPFQEQQFEQQQQYAVDEANEAIDEQMNQLHEQHGDFDEQMVYRLAYAHADSSNDPIASGFEDYQRFVANIETGTVTNKLNTPGPAEPGGPANTNQTPPKTFADAKDMARERFASAKQF